MQADADSLTLVTEGNTTSKVNKVDILRIRSKSRAMGALIGTATGMVGGAVVGTAHPFVDVPGRAASALVGAMAVGVWGTIIGVVIGLNRTIYENPSSKLAPTK